jgi:hypothetical protein
MPAFTGFRCVQHEQDRIWVNVDLGHGIAVRAVVHRKSVEAEHLRPHTCGRRIEGGNIHPSQTRPS